MKIYQVIPCFNMHPYIMEAIKTVTKQYSRLAPNPYDFDVSVIDADSFTEPTIILQGSVNNEKSSD